MEFRVLGPVDVRNDDVLVPLGGPRNRVVLALMLLNDHRVVPVAQLIDAVWGEAPPHTATAQVQAAVSALRKALGKGGSRIITQAPGYVIQLQPGELDLVLFERDLHVARRARAEGDVERAASGLRAALDWWRGGALSDLVDHPVHSLAIRLDELRTVALEERIDADLTLGRHAMVVPDLTALVAEHPLRERPRAQLMLALYRSGRQADALAVYQNGRAVLVEELGLEPGPELRDLEKQILDADPGLDLPQDGVPAHGIDRGVFVRPPCPFRGLDAFSMSDRDVFFGRRTEIGELVARLRGPGPVTLVGPSGCGKSSLIFAGVVPRLDATTAVATFRPGAARSLLSGLASAFVPVLEPGQPAPGRLSPVADLATELDSDGLSDVVTRVLVRNGAERLVLVVDQAEELLAQNPADLDRFAELVFGVGAPPELKVVSTLRTDFLDAALSRPLLSAPLRQSIYTLGAMTSEQLREVVTDPVAGTGVTFQDGLVERILTDLGTDPGALPLLGLTLTLLWERQYGSRLTHQAYDDLGQVTGSLARYAEEVWRRSNLVEEEDDARLLFTQLISVTANGEPTRRVATREELGEPRWRMARQLATSRLLVAGQDAEGHDSVELAHEALVRGWSRLAGWIEADREFRQWQEGLRADLARWERAGQDPNQLVRASALRDAQRWSDERAGDLSTSEIEFIGRAGSHQRAAARRSTLLRSGLAIGLVVVMVLGSLFFLQRRATDRRSADATSRALAAASGDWAERDAVYSAMLALAAHRVQPTAEATTALFRPYLESQGATTVLSNPQAGLSDVQISHDGRVVAAATKSNRITVWTRSPGQETRRITTPILRGTEPYMALSADGTAVWLVDDGWLARFDVADGQLRRVMEVADGGSMPVAVSADGATVLVEVGSNNDRRTAVWDARQGRSGRGWALPAGETLMKVNVDPAGSLVAQFNERDAAGQLSQRIEVWGPADGARRTVAQGMNDIVVTAAGDVAVTCAVTGLGSQRLVALRLADGVELGRAETEGSCTEIAADRSGLTVVQREGSASAAVLDLRTGETVSRVRAPILGESRARAVPVLAGSGDELRLAVWNESRVALLAVPPPGTIVPEMPYSFLSRDGGLITGVVGNRSELMTYPVTGTAPTATAARPAPHWPSGPRNLVASKDGVLVADRVSADRVVVRRRAGLEPVREITTTRVPPRDVEANAAPQKYDMFFGPSGRLITAVGHQVEVWDVPTGEKVAQLDLLELGHATPDQVVELGAVPDQDRLWLVVEGRPDVRILDVGSGSQVATVPAGDDIVTVFFHHSPLALIVRSGGAVEAWNVEEGRRVLGPLVADAEFERRVGVLDEPGRFVVGDAGQYRIWDVGSPGPRLNVQFDDALGITSVSGDGTIVMYRESAIYIGVLRLAPAVWRDHVCSVIGRRGFDEAERAGLPPSTPDGPLCP